MQSRSLDWTLGELCPCFPQCMQTAYSMLRTGAPPIRMDETSSVSLPAWVSLGGYDAMDASRYGCLEVWMPRGMFGGLSL